MFKQDILSLGNPIWPNSPKLMKVLVKIGLNRLSSLHIPPWHIAFFKFPISSLRFWEYLIMVETKIYRFVTLFFWKNLQRYHHWSAKPTDKIFKEVCKSLPFMVDQWQQFCFLEPLKCLFHHSVNTSLT